MLRKFFWPEKRKIAIFLILAVILVPIHIIGSAAIEKADDPSSKQLLLESLEETLGPLGQFISAVCSIISLVFISLIFLFALITQSSSFGFVLGIATIAILVYITACLVDMASKKWIS